MSTCIKFSWLVKINCQRGGVWRGQPREKRTFTESSIRIRIEREVSSSVYLKGTLYFSKFDSILRYFLEYLFRSRIARHPDFGKWGSLKKQKSKKKNALKSSRIRKLREQIFWRYFWDFFFAEQNWGAGFFISISREIASECSKK